MKKFIIFCLLCSLSLSGFALSVGDTFIKNSRFWQNKFAVEIISEDTTLLGLDFDLTEHRDIENKIYNFRLPFMLRFALIDLVFEPFFYPNTDNDASAYGGSFIIKGLLRENQIDNSSSQGYLKIAYANQSANVARTSSPIQKENFKQFAFEGGINYNYQGLFAFDVSGNIYTYKDETKDLTYFGGIMNQSELGNLGTLDYVLDLPKFSVGGGITWISPENNAKSFISYKYISFEQELTIHSVMLNTMVQLEDKIILSLTYNHLFETHKVNRDIFGIGLNYLF